MKNHFQLLFSSLLLLFVFNSCHTRKAEQKAEKHEMNDWFINQRIFPSGKMDYKAYRNAVNSVRLEKSLLRMNGISNDWKYAGPENIGGRITDVEMHPSSLQVMYLCAASGGIFKSTDGGNIWIPVFDEQSTLSIGDLAIAPSDANRLYAGTGEANGGGGSLTYDGMGVYVSEDGGTTWNHVGLDSTRNTGRIAIHPSNKDIAYVAAMGDLFGDTPQRGLYKTSDGGNNWQQVLFQNDSTGAIDVVIHPLHPDTVFACQWTRVRRPDRRHYGGPASGIYRSFDGGNTWSNLTGALNLPGNAGRIGIDISQTNPDILFATVTDEEGINVGIYKSIDLGTHWAPLLSPSAGAYSYWYGRIKIDPTNPDIVYFIDFDLYKTIDGGLSWNRISNNVHVDQHEVYIHPQNNSMVLLGNDGGFFLSNDGGNSWAHNETLPITQFYTCEMDEQNPLKLFGGAQDNGVLSTSTGSFNDWIDIWYGDGFAVLVDPNDSTKVYTASQYGNLNTGLTGVDPASRFNWNTPVIFNPRNSNSLYLGSNTLYKSTDRGANWTQISPDLTNNTGIAIAYPIVYETITSIDVSAADTNMIYVGTDDGHVWMSGSNGSNWSDVSNGLPLRWVSRVAADPSNAMNAYVTLSGYRYHDNMSHVYFTNNAGQSWNDISGNLPDVPVNDIVIDTVNSKLFLATDVGVFHTAIGSTNWQILGTALPIVPVMDLRIHYPSMTLLAATYGRSMYTYDLNLVSGTANHLPHKNKMSMRIYPLPFHDKATIELILNNNATGAISIWDVNGHKLKTVSEGSFQNGSNKIQLHLTPLEKEKIKNGVLFARFISSDGELISVKFLCIE